MTFHGQSLQDLFVLSVLKNKRTGTFLEIGSNDPIKINNSYVLEKEYGWRGILVEYDAKWEAAYKEKRTSPYILQDAAKIDYEAAFEKYSMPTQIDYLQIDLEVDNGSTLATLERLDSTVLNTHTFSVITFEHDIFRGDHFGTRAKSREIFAKRGYFRVFGDVRNHGYPYEDWYVYPSSVDMNYIFKIKTDESLEYSELVARF